jgi:hypothetical protein
MGAASALDRDASILVPAVPGLRADEARARRSNRRTPLLRPGGAVISGGPVRRSRWSSKRGVPRSGADTLARAQNEQSRRVTVVYAAPPTVPRSSGVVHEAERPSGGPFDHDHRRYRRARGRPRARSTRRGCAARRLPAAWRGARSSARRGGSEPRPWIGSVLGVSVGIWRTSAVVSVRHERLGLTA